MSLKINQEIETVDGFTVPSGSIVRFDTTFKQGSTSCIMNLFFYKDEEVINQGKNPYNPILLNGRNFYKKDYTINQYTGLTPTQIHLDLKEYLLTIYTGGTIDIIL